MHPKTRQGFQNLRKHCWACLKGCAVYTAKQDQCNVCGEPLQYFASKGEFKRWRWLLLAQRAGVIANLQVQPEYSIDVNGEHVCTYRADFAYMDLEKKRLVVEDVKGSTNEKHLDPVFKLKRALVKAIWGLDIELVKA